MSSTRRPSFERSLSVVQRQFNWREPVRPFVSSTFRDFQAERDLLVKCVFPKLEQLCRLRGTYFAPVDLRWGITSKQASSGDVVRLCLDFVARSAPYFIGLLGERYGSHIAPSDESSASLFDHGCVSEDDWLRQSLEVARRSGYAWVGEEQCRHYSITELEIELAAFRQRFVHTRFYFRHPQDVPDGKSACGEAPFAVAALRCLKERIVKADLPVGHFSTPAELADLVADDWRAIIDEVYPPLFDTLSTGVEEREGSGAPHQLFAEWAAHEAFAETRRRAFVATPQVVEVARRLSQLVDADLDELSAEEAQSPVGNSPAFLRRSAIAVVVGERGSGKSALLANWCRELHDDDAEVRVVAHYVGSSANSATPLGFMLHCIDELRASFLDVATSSKTEHREDRSDIVRVRAAFAASLGLGRCVVVLDGLDEMTLEGGRDEHEVLDWLPSPLPVRSQLVVSTSQSHISFRALQLRADTTILELGLLDDASARRLLVERHLAVHCKQLDADQMGRVVQSQLASFPVFLASLANELRIFGIHEHVGDRLDYYLAATSIGELWERILRRWAHDYGWDTEGRSVKSSTDKHLHGWVADALRLVAVSRQGLREDETLAVLSDLGYSLSTLDWASFRSAAGDALFERQAGLLNFLHQPLRNAVLEHLLDVQDAGAKSTAEVNCYNAHLETKGTWHGKLADILEAWPPSLRRTEELPWQRNMAGDMPGLLRCVSEPAVFVELADHHDQRSHGMLTLDLWNYWHCLTAAGFDQAATYEKMLMVEREKLVAGRRSVSISQRARFALIAGAVGQLHASNGRFVASQKALNDALTEAELVAKGASCLRSDSGDSDADRNQLTVRSAHSGFELLSTIQEQLANLFLYQLKITDAENWYHAALASASHADDGGDLQTVDSTLQERRGRLLDALGYLKAKDTSPRSQESQKEAVSLLMEANKCMVAAGSTPGQADVAFHLAVARVRQGFFPQAEEGLREALRARRGWYGVDHPFVAEVMNELAGLLCNPRRRQTQLSFEEAEKLYRRALEVRRRTLGDNHLLVATTLFHLGKLLAKSKERPRVEEAKSILQKSLDIRTIHLGTEHVITRAVKRSLNQLAADLEKRDRRRESDSVVSRPHDARLDTGSGERRESMPELRCSSLANEQRDINQHNRRWREHNESSNPRGGRQQCNLHSTTPQDRAGPWQVQRGMKRACDTDVVTSQDATVTHEEEENGWQTVGRRQKQHARSASHDRRTSGSATPRGRGRGFQGRR